MGVAVNNFQVRSVEFQVNVACQHTREQLKQPVETHAQFQAGVNGQWYADVHPFNIAA